MSQSLSNQGSPSQAQQPPFRFVFGASESNEAHTASSMQERNEEVASLKQQLERYKSENQRLKRQNAGLLESLTAANQANEQGESRGLAYVHLIEHPLISQAPQPLPTSIKTPQRTTSPIRLICYAWHVVHDQGGGASERAQGSRVCA